MHADGRRSNKKLSLGFKIMTTANEHKIKNTHRMTQLFDICRQRYLDAGGDPRKPVNCNEWMTPQEQQEFFELGN
jgi:hypothetical protein